MIPTLPPFPAPPPPAKPDAIRSGSGTGPDLPFDLGREPAPGDSDAGGLAAAQAAALDPPPAAVEPTAAHPPALGQSLALPPTGMAPAQMSAAPHLKAAIPTAADPDAVAGGAPAGVPDGAAAGAEARQALPTSPGASPALTGARLPPPAPHEGTKIPPVAAGAAALAAVPGLAAALRAAMPDAPGTWPSPEGPPTVGPAVADAMENTGPARPAIALDATAGPTGGTAPAPRDAGPAPSRADAPAPAPQPATPPPASLAVTTLVQSVELVMAPEELGALRVQVSGEGEAMRLILAAERPETLDLMRRHSDALLADLRQSGHGGAALAFGQWSGPAGSQAGAPAAGPDTAEEASAASVPAPHTARAGSTGLDLRL